MTNTKTKSEGAANYTVQLFRNEKWDTIANCLTLNQARGFAKQVGIVLKIFTESDKRRIVTDSGLIVE